MKTLLTIATTLAFAPTLIHAQNLAAYQSAITGQAPMYYNSLDNSLAPSAGAGTFTSATGAAFANDYFGNANDAVSFSLSTAQLSCSSGATIINGGGAANSVGSLSMLLYTPNTALTGTQYIFSNGDAAGANGNLFALSLGGTALSLKAGNKTTVLPNVLTGGAWYYFATTWDFSGANSSAYGIHYYLGLAGQPDAALTSGFVQRGGTGNIASTSILGNGGAFVLSGHQVGSPVTGGFQIAGIPGAVDELATWSTQLSAGQITTQFDALILAPEPSGGLLLGLGGMLALLRGSVCEKTKI